MPPLMNREDLKLRLERHMDVLCNQIGERHLGSEGEKKAVRYIVKQFEDMGCEVVREEFSAPGWQYGKYSLTAVESGQTFPCFPCFYSNACDAAGKLLVIDRGNVNRLRSLKVEGALCFYTEPTHVGAVGGRNKLAEKLDKLGAAALLIISDHPDTENTKLIRSPHLKRLGVMTVSGDAALKMGRHKQCNFRIRIEARNFETKAANIVARFKTPAAKKVLAGAHYDTAPGISGAGDNATGVAALIELARLFKGLDSPVEFVSFGGEEYGGARNRYPIGSFEYCRAHRKELKRIAVFCDLDCLGVSWGRNVVQVSKSKTAKSLERIARNAAKGYSIEHCRGDRLGGDCLAFEDNGVPCIWVHSDHSYIRIHTPKDDIGNIDFDKLTGNCETSFRLLTRLANGTVRRQYRSQEGFL